jgi:phage host-nuclease inhibitor protein Gam
MSKKKESVRIIAVALASREEAARVVRETVHLQLSMEAAIVKRDKIVLRITHRSNAGIDELGFKIATNMAQLQYWADANPGEFAPAKSTKIDGHALGWRLGNHQTKLLKGWTWAKAVAALQESRKKIKETFLRVKTEANKEAMVERRSRKKLLATFGVEIIQGETFYLEPNREGQPDVTLQGTKQEVAA